MMPSMGSGRWSRASMAIGETSKDSLWLDSTFRPLYPSTSLAISGLGRIGVRSGLVVGTKNPTVRLLAVRYFCGDLLDLFGSDLLDAVAVRK